jgi:DNA-binding MarR family transcriptional regulator
MTPKEYDSAINEFMLSVGVLVRRVRAAAPSEHHELSWTQKSVLARLDKEGAMTAADLARAEGVKPQSMGTAIMHLEVTAKGAAVRKNGKDASRAWLAQSVAKLDKKDQSILFAASEIIKRLAEL